MSESQRFLPFAETPPAPEGERQNETNGNHDDGEAMARIIKSHQAAEALFRRVPAAQWTQWALSQNKRSQRAKR
ncbi:MAG: hypothetical protein WC698_05035 [Candidatus Peribacteraceae bacterium]